MSSFDEPNMSDATLLLSVEDLIHRAMGPPDGNVINFKIIQMILHILARQQRVLEQRVEIRIADLEAPRYIRKSKEKSESSSSKSPRSPTKRKMAGIKEERQAKNLSPKKDKDKEVTDEDEKKGKADRKGGKGKDKIDKLQQKEQEKLEKEEITQKEQEKAQKEQEKTLKQQEKTQKELEKEAQKESKQVEKEKAKAEKEKIKAEKERAKAEKEREKADKERLQSPKGAKKARVASTSEIAITESKWQNEKVLVVEKGPTTRGEPRGKKGIDVVTQSQFALLEAAVRELRDIAVPKPLVLPDNKKLKSDLKKGSATLIDTMQAMQVNARVNAAEDAIRRMTGILTALAASGELPDDLLARLDDITTAGERPSEAAVKSRSKKSVGIDLKVSQAPLTGLSSVSQPLTPKASEVTMASKGSFVSKMSTMSMGEYVTRDEMNSALKELREALSKNLTNLTNKANTAAENALHTSKTIEICERFHGRHLKMYQQLFLHDLNINTEDPQDAAHSLMEVVVHKRLKETAFRYTKKSDRLDVALKLDSRISTLYSLVEDYAEQLSGFDAGLTTQMQSFQDQMAQIRADLKGGLDQLDNVNNNAETAAVQELTERYQDLVAELDTTVDAHKGLTALQSELGGEMHTLVGCVEMLREQKSDRDEVIDGLRDKADTTRLTGLLSEADFAKARADFERRIEVCYDKFHRQEAVWMQAIKDLTNTTDHKAELMDLLSARHETEKQLRDLHDKIRLLATVLGDPKAALLTRQLAVDAACGACRVPALMQPQDAIGGAPARLPALRPPPQGAPDTPCLTDWMVPEPPKDKHICHRWCGGSHTLMTETTTRERATGIRFQTVPTTKYTGYGDDGRLYMMEEELKPCVECNVFSPDRTEQREPGRGAGDTFETEDELQLSKPKLEGNFPVVPLNPLETRVGSWKLEAGAEDVEKNDRNDA